MGLLSLCLFIGALAALAWLIVRQPAAPENHLAETRDETLQYHAVGVVTGEHPCASVQRIYGQRYLSDGAPRFPLPGCDAGDCLCRYEHYADRRQGDDRRDIWVAAGPVQHYVEPDMTPRQRVDRRSG